MKVWKPDKSQLFAQWKRRKTNTYLPQRLVDNHTNLHKNRGRIFRRFSSEPPDSPSGFRTEESFRIDEAENLKPKKFNLYARLLGVHLFYGCEQAVIINKNL